MSDKLILYCLTMIHQYSKSNAITIDFLFVTNPLPHPSGCENGRDSGRIIYGGVNNLLYLSSVLKESSCGHIIHDLKLHICI